MESKENPECLDSSVQDERAGTSTTSPISHPSSNEPVYDKDKPVVEKPTLLKLKTMNGADGKPLKIVQKIAAHDYTTFGMFLLQDENGEEVDLIEKDHIIRAAERVTEAIFKKWLTSDAPTRTYQHLIECLRQSELGALSDQLIAANTTSVKGMHCPLVTYTI